MQGLNCYLDAAECREKFGGKQVFVFGTGVDAEQLQQELKDDIQIIAYIDNNRAGEDNRFYGKGIISLHQCMERKKEEQPIIIATYRFAAEICEQLKAAELVAGKDFYVWDDMCLFHEDEDTQCYVQFLGEIWKKKTEKKESKILVPFDNRHGLMHISYAYAANYFAEKYDAGICAYFRGGAEKKNASKVIMQIYSAFNVEELIDSELDEKQEKEAHDICERVWQTLYTWEDWKNISIYGIIFGTDIVTNFLRVGIPTFDLRSEKMYTFLKKSIRTIVFWHHYIYENDIKIVLLADGVSWDGYIRDIALSKGIPAYALCYKMEKTYQDFHGKTAAYEFLAQMWEQLSDKEREYGLKWAEEHISKRLQGDTAEVWESHKGKYTFALDDTEEKLLEENDKIKVVIFPHIFEEDSYGCGYQIFDNNYFSWLCHLGELSEKTPQYDWYLKLHPNAQRRDYIIMDMLLQRYPKIKKIPSDVSPKQLKKEGVKFALTVCGTIGHELPEIGIQVINAGNNPHQSFDFTWNPTTKEEYDELIYSLDKLDKKLDKEQLYKFYSLYYLYYDWAYVPYNKLFFKNQFLGMAAGQLKLYGKTLGTWMYKEYMKEWTENRHNEIVMNMENIFKKLDEWKPHILYKRDIEDTINR